MKKEIFQVDKERGICRVTTLDERFYGREGKDPVSGLPTIEWRPSITYIGHFYPKGKGFEQYLKKNGDDADLILALAGERGSKVHQAIEMLNLAETVKMGDKFANNRTGEPEELTPDEYHCVRTYRDWWQAEGSALYEILGVEEVVWPEGKDAEPGGPMHFAGTLDLYVRRIADNTTGVIDVKTSKDIYPGHIIQVSALAAAKKADWGGIIQVGYTRNKHGYKFTETPLRMDLFEAARTIWAYETEGEKPLQRDYPLELTLGLPPKGLRLAEVKAEIFAKHPAVEEAYEEKLAQKAQAAAETPVKSPKVAKPKKAA
jgi:hypothetical protein